MNKVPVHFIFCEMLWSFKFSPVNGNILCIVHLIINLQGGQKLAVILIKLTYAVCVWKPYALCTLTYLTVEHCNMVYQWHKIAEHSERELNTWI